jgi:hypothetical protein
VSLQPQPPEPDRPPEEDSDPFSDEPHGGHIEKSRVTRVTFYNAAGEMSRTSRVTSQCNPDAESLPIEDLITAAEGQGIEFVEDVWIYRPGADPANPDLKLVERELLERRAEVEAFLKRRAASAPKTARTKI